MKRDYTSGFLNPYKLTKTVLESSSKFYDVRLYMLAHGKYPKELYLFLSATYHTVRNYRVRGFSFFRHCETFFENFFKGSPFNFFDVLQQKCYKIPKVPPFSAPIRSNVWIFRYCKREYLTLRSPIAVFEP